MQDNPYYNNLSYLLLVLDQVIADRPSEAISSFPLKANPERLHATSLILTSGSKSMAFL